MRIVWSHSHSPYFNLATEEYLFSRCKGDFLLFYVNNPSVIVGANQVLANEVNVSFCKTNKVEIARRMSGGGTVFHDAGNLNYCFITDKNAEKAAMDTDFLKPIVEVLAKFGIPAQVGKRKDLWLPNGFKISGTASHIARNRILFHGTLLYDAQIDVLQKVLTVKEKILQVKGIASVPSPVKNIKTYLTENVFKAEEKEIFFNQLVQSMADYFQVKIEILSMEEMEEIEKIAATKYQKEEWIYRK